MGFVVCRTYYNDEVDAASLARAEKVRQERRARLEGPTGDEPGQKRPSLNCFRAADYMCFKQVHLMTLTVIAIALGCWTPHRGRPEPVPEKLSEVGHDRTAAQCPW